MRLFVIGNPDAVWGFALAGVRGSSVVTADELARALDAATADEEVGIVLITEDVAELARQRIDDLVTRSHTPLVVEIPGPGGRSPDRPSLGEVIRQTIGVKV